MGLSWASVGPQLLEPLRATSFEGEPPEPLEIKTSACWNRVGFAFGLAFLSALASLKFVLEQKSGFLGEGRQ